MRKRAVITALVVAVGCAAFVAAFYVKRTTLAFPLGTTTSTIAVSLSPGRTVCQGPITVPSYGAFDRIVLQLGTYAKPGPPLAVTLRDGSRVLERAALAGGYPDVGTAPHQTIQFGRLLGGRRLEICLANRGRSPVAIYGAGGNASRQSHASVERRRVGNDLNIEFRRPSRTYASLLGSIVDRAALWRTPHPPGWLYALLLALLVAGAGGGVVFAVARVGDGD